MQLWLGCGSVIVWAVLRQWSSPWPDSIQGQAFQFQFQYQYYTQSVSVSILAHLPPFPELVVVHIIHPGYHTEVLVVGARLWWVVVVMTGLPGQYTEVGVVLAPSLWVVVVTAYQGYHTGVVFLSLLGEIQV